jgi:hypothetical protein
MSFFTSLGDVDSAVSWALAAGEEEGISGGPSSEDDWFDLTTRLLRSYRSVHSEGCVSCPAIRTRPP